MIFTLMLKFILTFIIPFIIKSEIYKHKWDCLMKIMSTRRKHKQKKKKLKKKLKSNERRCKRPELYMKLSQSDRYCVIAGYFIRHKKRCPSDINRLIDSFYNDTTFQYTISKDDFRSKYLVCAPGDKLSSDSFDITWNNHRFSFQLTIYPNGHELDHCGSCDLMIECLTNIKDYHIKKLTFYLILYCRETENETRGLRIMEKDICKWRWAPYSMKLSECQKCVQMEFKCYIDLLRIEYESAAPLAPYVSRNDGNMLMSNIEYKWRIHKPFASIWGKIHYSNNFNSNYWTVICIPQGHNYAERSKFKLRLRLLRMPYNVQSMLVHFTMNIKGFEQFGVSQTSLFTINGDGDHCNNYHLVFANKESVVLNKMSVWCATVTIQIIKLFDLKEKPIAPHQWSKHNVLYQCDTVRL
eukprot:1074587_1